MDPILEKFRNELIQISNKSQDNFEKQLSYISAGSIGISMAFTENIIGTLSNTGYKVLLVLGWILLASTLLINLFSHIKAYNNHSNTIKEIDENKYDQKIAIQRNQLINRYNKLSILSMISGITLILIFITLNIF